MSSKQAYLAAKYMSGPKADAILARAEDAQPSKKKKKKRPAGEGSSRVVQGGLMIEDQDGSVWGAVERQVEDEEDDAPVVQTTTSRFKPRQSTWQTDSPPPLSPPAPDIPADEQPQVISTPDDPPVAPRRGGLMTAAEMRAEEAEIAAAEAVAKERALASRTAEEEEVERRSRETVYRDASGQKIDLKKEKAEERRRLKERAEKEAERMEWGKGIVQRGEKEENVKRLKEEKSRDLARYANDASLNAEQKETARWNDPAANFLTKSKPTGPALPMYKGPWAPNRFGIPPGYRWDGVDRSTGFETKFFQAQNSKKRFETEAYSWSVDDM